MDSLKLELNHSNTSISLKDHKLLYFYNQLENYFVNRTISEHISVNDVSDFDFWIDFNIPNDVNFLTILLNATIWTFYQTLSNLEKTVVDIQIHSNLKANNYTIECFVALSEFNMLKDLDFYQNKMNDYKGRFGFLNNIRGKVGEDEQGSRVPGSE